MSLDQIEIKPCGPIKAGIRPPSSKSITNRALICAALAEGQSTLQWPLVSDDTEVMIDSLQKLGVSVTRSDGALVVDGCNGSLPRDRAELSIGNSGTSVRFLTAMMTVGEGTFSISGVPRMHQRPIQDLLDALNELGADVASIDATGCPPVSINARGLNGGSVSIRGNVSSQFLSGLLMAAPYARAPIVVKVDGELISQPYVDMTLAVMAEFGVSASAVANSTVQNVQNEFRIPASHYTARSYEIEPDASAASYFWAAAAITGGQVEVCELTRGSLQGDVEFCDLLVRMGCELKEGKDSMTIRGPAQLKGIECNMAHVSDTAQTLSVVALFADGPTTIRGVAHNRYKETDRIGNLATELRKFGAVVDELEDGMTIHPPKSLTPAEIDTYEDHRMAMSLALPGLKVAGVRINDPDCTAKTYPRFFEDLAQISQT